MHRPTDKLDHNAQTDRHDGVGYLNAVVEEEVGELVLERRVGIQHLEEQSGAGHQEGDDPDTQQADGRTHLLHALFGRVDDHLHQDKEHK